MGLRSYRQLTVWQKAIELVLSVYELTESLPAQEKFALQIQLRRAAVSIAANIAEGYGRSHRGDYLHHLSIARGSLAELETLLTIGGKLRFYTRVQAVGAWNLAQETGRMLTRLVDSLARAPKHETYASRTPDPKPQTPNPGNE